MIKNQRQYRITKAQADNFTRAISQMRADPVRPADVHPLLMKAQEDALQSQLDDLQAQLSDYDSLRSGQQKVFHVESLAELPRALIQARIVEGLSQKQLAARLGLAEQQIQQYEASEYASASFSRIQETAQALGVLVREEVFLPGADVSRQRLFHRLGSVGIDTDLVLNRLLPPPFAAQLENEQTGVSSKGGLVLKAAAAVGRVFGLKPADIFADAPLRLDSSALGSARFKLPPKMDRTRAVAYTIYAHYVALLALESTRHIERKPVPHDPLAEIPSKPKGLLEEFFQNPERSLLLP